MAVLVISYPRIHQREIRPLVTLLKASMPKRITDAVYWDELIPAGGAWLPEFTRAIDHAGKLFVVWCSHSVESVEMPPEYEYALEKRKMVIPVLLDDTPLPKNLNLVQGIDLRGVIAHDPPASALDTRRLLNLESVSPSELGRLADLFRRRLEPSFWQVLLGRVTRRPPQGLADEPPTVVRLWRIVRQFHNSLDP